MVLGMDKEFIAACSIWGLEQQDTILLIKDACNTKMEPDSFPED